MTTRAVSPPRAQATAAILIKWDWYLLFPLATPLLLLAPRNGAFLFDGPGWLDPFMYVGYFWHYPEHLQLFDTYYKISRLPWILPGFIAHAAAGEVIGSYLLHTTVLSSGAAAMYLLIRDTLKSTTVAVATSVAWACCTWSHGVGGWNYHILGASVYYLFGCWFVVRGARHWSAPRAIAAGALLVAAVHTHLFFVVFAPLVIAQAVAARPAFWPVQWTAWARYFGWIATGGLGCTVALGAINAATGGSWFFFMPQLDYTLWLSHADNNRWWNGNVAAWLPSATYLVLPLLALLAGTLSLVRPAVGESRRFQRVFVLQLWAAFAIFCYYTFISRQTSLDNSYMAFPLYSPAFPALATALQRLDSERESTASRVALCAFIVAAIVGPLLFSFSSPFHTTIRTTLQNLPPIVGPLVAGAAGIVLTSLVNGRGLIVAFCVWFTVINVWIAPSPTAYGVRTHGFYRSMLTLFHDADRFTTALDPSLLGIRYWFTREQGDTSSGRVELAGVFDSYVSTRGWLGNLFAQKSPPPPIDDITPANVDGTVCVGLLSSLKSHDDLRNRLVSQFARLHQPLVEVASRRFERPELSFALSVFRISKPSSDPNREPLPSPPCLR